MRGLVSVALPTFNGERTVEAAVRSALQQSYEPMQIVVTDDASTDATVATIRRLGVEPMINRHRLGANRNWNAAVNRSAGEFIKFLHQDDELGPHCIRQMVEILERHPSAGMVFCRRTVRLHHDNPAERGWLETYREPHRGFASLAELNARGSLARQLLDDGLSVNSIGEPVCVLVRREVLERLGGFHNHVRQVVDLDLWFRIAAHYDVAFIDEELATYRVSTTSLTGENRRKGLDWLDRLWMLDGLARDAELLRAYPEIASMRERELRMALRTLISRNYAAPSVRIWLKYAAERFVLRRPVYGEIVAPPATSSS